MNGAASWMNVFGDSNGVPGGIAQFSWNTIKRGSRKRSEVVYMLRLPRMRQPLMLEGRMGACVVNSMHQLTIIWSNSAFAWLWLKLKMGWWLFEWSNAMLSITRRLRRATLTRRLPFVTTKSGRNCVCEEEVTTPVPEEARCWSALPTTPLKALTRGTQWRQSSGSNPLSRTKSFFCLLGLGVYLNTRKNSDTEQWLNRLKCGIHGSTSAYAFMMHIV